MKLSQLRLRNFRCFQEEITIDFEDLTALIGRNDAGKSSIMDSLDIFLNDGFPDKNDASKNGDSDNLSIACIFSDFPDSLVLDEDYSTSLQKEYLLNPDGYLEIHKVFSGGLEKPKLKILKLVANHPTAENITDLISLNNTELKKRAKDLGIITSGIDLKINAQLRQVIRESVDNLKLASVEIDLLDGNGKKLWSGIQAKLPAFGLFKSDRASTDQDAEVQDPLNTAIQAAIKSQEIELNKIALHIQSEVKKVADLTLKKLQEMDATLATTLSPQFSPPRWAGLFKASITGDNNIPINKRGSGVRRLILLSFFRAQVELHKNEKNKQNILYAIEEPETSQHPHNQRLLVSALQELAGDNQVIITTHTPMLARIIPAKALRFIRAKEDNPNTREIILGGSEETNKLIANSLGVLPDHNVKLFIGVEGKHDLPFLKNMSRLLISAGVAAPNLEQLELDGKLIFTPLGGSG
jgi:putative ATP-dependent endonuclease of OLD family